MKKILAFVVLIMLGGSPAHAELIYLKDGSIIKGKVMGKTAYYTTIQTEKYPKKIFNEDIDRIEDDIAVQLDGASTAIIEKNNISEVKASLILKLLKANGSREKVDANIQDVLDKVSPENRAQIEAVFDADEIMAQLIPVYDKYYTEDDIVKMVEFYSSNLGQKIQNTTPDVVKDVIETTLKYFQEKVSSIP